jgi:carbamoyl-phosphate synthase large subunit
MASNILISSAGRRVSLVRAFQKELKSLIPDSKVFAGDVNPLWSAACRVADAFIQLPRISEPEFINSFLQSCLAHKVGLVVPTLDTELKLLSANRSLFKSHGIQIAVSDEQLVDQCRDKRKTNSLFQQLGIEIPRMFEKGQMEFPLFIKPYDGSLSKDIFVINDPSDWRESFLNNEKLMFMEYLSPEEYQEFTVDAYFDSNGLLKCLVPRRRIEVRGGEISKGRTERKELYYTLKEKFSSLPCARSCLTMQFFEHKDTHRIIGIEINPRFGGGFPLSYEAGANYPKYLIEEYLLGNNIEFCEDWRSGKVMLRYDSEVLFDEEIHD